MKFLKSIFTFIFFGLLGNCSGQNNENEISINELIEIVKKDSTTLILDVRTEEELKGSLGKIEGVINIPLQQLEDRLNELEKHKDSTLNIICRTGRRSAIATSILISKGYSAKNIKGGMVAYRNKGH